MKTLNLIRPAGREILALMLLCSSFLFFSSCKKENTVVPSGNAESSISQKQGIQSKNVYTMLKIDHFAMRSMLSDYCVEIDNKGLVTYTGRHHVGVYGKVQFNVTNAIVMQIKNMYASVDFYHRGDDQPSGS